MKIAAVVFAVGLWFGVAAPLAAQEPITLAAAEKLLQGDATALDALKEAQQVAALRCALHSRDDGIARAAAARLHYLHLDATECAQVALLLFPSVLLHENAADMEQWRSLLGSVEAGPILRSWKEWPRGADVDLVGFFGILHRALRAEHIPLLLEIAKDKADPEMATAAMNEMAAAMLPHTDQHRSVVARALLLRAGRMPPAGTNGSGLDPLLRALLEMVQEKGPDALPRGGAPWLCRWLLQSEAASLADLAALQAVGAMAKVEPKLGLMLAVACVRAAAGIKEAKATQWLETLVADEALLSSQALASLARRGDTAARTALLRRAAEDADALALLCDAAPDAAKQVLARIANPADAAQARAAAQQLAALADSCEQLALPDVAQLVLDALAPLLRAPRHALLLARVGSAFPGCATRPVAIAALTALAREGAPATDPLEFAETTADFAFLESRARSELETLLRMWAAEPPTAAVALRLLVRMGAGTTAATLLASSDEVSEQSLRALPAEQSEKLRAALVAVLRDEFAAGEPLARALRWMAVLGGVSTKLAGAMADCERSEEVDALVRAALADGRTMDALVALLPALRAADIRDLGLVSDPRVQEFLRGLRDQRETKFHAVAIGELARSGDAAAKEELRAVIVAGRYRWLDDEDAAVLSFERDLREMPWWIGELESNCCRAVVARRVLEDMFGWELPGMSDCISTDAALVRRRFDAAKGQFAFSAIANCFLPAP